MCSQKLSVTLNNVPKHQLNDTEGLQYLCFSNIFMQKSHIYCLDSRRLSPSWETQRIPIEVVQISKTHR